MNRAPVVVAALAAAALIAGSAVYPVVSSAPEPRAATVEPVESSRLVCPDPFAGTGVTSVVTGFVAPGLPGQNASAGAAAIATMPAKGTAVQRAAIPAVAAARSLSTEGERLPPVIGTGVGSLAPGLAVDQVTLATTGRTRGLAAMECFAAGTDQWFVGGSSAVGRAATVTLANPENSPATADVLLYGPDGPLPAPAGRGVFIPARGQAQVSLTTLAPGVSRLAVHVQTRSGRVSASVSDRSFNGLIPRGVDFVPQTPAPETRVVVTGIPGKVTPVILSVLSPDRDATVTVRVLTPAGSYAPAGLTTLELSAGALKSVDITKVLRQQPAAVELSSSAPIVAGAWYQLGSETGVAEFAYAPGAAVLATPAVIAGLPTASGYRHRLYLTNTSGTADASAVVTLIDRNRKSTKVTLRIPRGTTQVWTAKSPGRGIFSLVITPGKGSAPLRGARVTSLPATEGTMATGVPLTPVRSRVTIPEAVPNLGVVLE